MKMTPRQYDMLVHEIQKFEDAYGEAALREYRHKVKFAKSQFLSFAWSMFWKIQPDTRAQIGMGLFDMHIETALKKALAKYA